jgi:aspartokinase-like uncharacterized kinase
VPDLVIKVGGSLLASVEQLDAVLATIAHMARSRRLLIVPGGGPFADVVRTVDRRLGIPDSAAHWMAVLGMDQHAHLLAARLPSGAVASGPADARQAVDHGKIPVLAPSRWLMDADPLPHSWEVTSDSIAAWVAGQVRARELILIKARGAEGALVDDYFARAVPSHIVPTIVPADAFALSRPSR